MTKREKMAIAISPIIGYALGWLTARMFHSVHVDTEREHQMLMDANYGEIKREEEW